ncbi:MAG: hypothetical protein EBR67_00650 [Proteobacteria bacterium]|nr:hypothetical protein [Pseudomonadota bacterium]
MTEHDLIRELGKYNLQDALLEIGKVSEYLYANPDASSEISNGSNYENKSVMFTQESLGYLAQLLIISGANDTKALYLSARKDKAEKLKYFFNVSGYLWYHVVHKSPDLKTENGEKIRIRDSDIWNAQFWLHLWERQAKYQIQRQSNRRHLLARQYLIFIKAYKHLTEKDAKKEEFKKRHKKLFSETNTAATEAKAENINPENKFKEKFSLSMKAFLILIFLGVSHNKELSWQQGKYIFNGCIDYLNISWEDEDLSEIQARLLEVNESIEKDSIIKALMPFSLSYKEFQEKAKELNPINPLMIYPLVRPDRKYKNRYPLFLSPVYPYLRNIILEDGLFNALDDIYREEFKSEGLRAAQPFRSFYGDLFEQFIKDLFINIYGQEKVSDLKIITDKKIYIIEIKSLKLNYHFALKDIYDEDKIEKNIEKLAEGVIQLYSENLACKQCNTEDGVKGATKTKKEAEIIPILVISDQTFSLISTSNKDGDSIFQEKITSLAIKHNLLNPDKKKNEKNAGNGIAYESLNFNFYILPLRFLEGNFNRLKNNEINLEDACYKSHSRTVFFNYDESKDTDSPSLDPDIENSNSYYDEAFEELMKF